MGRGNQQHVGQRVGVRCEVCVCLCVWGVGVVIDGEETGRLTSL